MIKLVRVMRKKQGISYEEFFERWKRHGELVTSGDGAQYLHKYVQTYRTLDVEAAYPQLKQSGTYGQEILDVVSGKATSSAEMFDGLAEVWYRTAEDMVKFFMSETAQRCAGDDEHFVDMDRSPLALLVEHPYVTPEE